MLFIMNVGFRHQLSYFIFSSSVIMLLLLLDITSKLPIDVMLLIIDYNQQCIGTIIMYPVAKFNILRFNGSFANTMKYEYRDDAAFRMTDTPF
jgi:hypothetical protein